LLFTSRLFSQREGDRIIAIVGNDIILESDLQYQLQMYARQNNVAQVSPALIQQIFQQILVEKIIFAKAEQDSITVKDEEVNKELDFRIKSIVDQYGSEQKVEQLYGMSIGKIKLTLKDELVKKLKADKLKRKQFSAGVHLTDKEVKDFYNSYKDSLPEANEEYELAHIYQTQKITDEEKQLAKEKAQLILDSVKNGVDFADLAKRNSDDPQSAVLGGDLGYAKKGVFVKEFEDALFTLNIGEISNLVETEYGYHIIKVIDKKGEMVKASHILVAYPHLPSNDLQTISFLKDLKNKILSNQISFDSAANLYSQDPETNKKGGYVGFVGIDKLDSSAVEGIKDIPVGSLSDPIKIGSDKNYGYELLKVISKNTAHKLTLETDYEKIKKYATLFKENSEMDKWIEELKKTVYVDVKF
jgi:peptidyl-prolyl cis-trans isomerase SurA